jgi:hypothetical protein
VIYAGLNVLIIILFVVLIVADPGSLRKAKEKYIKEASIV